jgi:hypothetical protein
MLYLALKVTFWMFEKWPLWIVIGAIACLVYRAPQTFDADRGAFFLNQCLSREFPNLPKTKERRNICMPEAIKKAEIEYAQNQK